MNRELITSELHKLDLRYRSAIVPKVRRRVHRAGSPLDKIPNLRQCTLIEIETLQKKALYLQISY
jgi:hypothetical protein